MLPAHEPEPKLPIHHHAQKQVPEQPGDGGKPDGVAPGVHGNGVCGVVGVVGVADGVVGVVGVVGGVVGVTGVGEIAPQPESRHSCSDANGPIGTSKQKPVSPGLPVLTHVYLGPADGESGVAGLSGVLVPSQGKLVVAPAVAGIVGVPQEHPDEQFSAICCHP